MKNLKTFLISFLVFVLPLNTNAENMETNFYYQTILDDVLPKQQNVDAYAPDFVQDHIVQNYQSMISDSNLCWAACMESLIKGYQTQSEVGNEQLEIAHYYTKNFCTTSHAKVDKIAMKDNHYESMYTKAGFHISSLDTEDLEHFNDMTSVLRNHSTLVIRSLENELSHILMIIGYKDGRYYVFDPDGNAKQFYYWAPKNIVMKYGVEKLWKVSIN